VFMINMMRFDMKLEMIHDITSSINLYKCSKII
jgi:hypothetical protein